MNVQQHDEGKGVWLLFHVGSGDIVATSHRKFEGVDEIEPVKIRSAQPQKVSDPLGDYR